MKLAYLVIKHGQTFWVALVSNSKLESEFEQELKDLLSNSQNPTDKLISYLKSQKIFYGEFGTFTEVLELIESKGKTNFWLFDVYVRKLEWRKTRYSGTLGSEFTQSINSINALKKINVERPANVKSIRQLEIERYDQIAADKKLSIQRLIEQKELDKIKTRKRNNN
jgi:predicted DNA-binding ribbon-helix-helix protein